MDAIIPIFIAIALLVSIVAVFIFIRSRAEKKEKTNEANEVQETQETKSDRDQKYRVKDAYRKLSQNPQDPNALLILGDSYFTHEAWAEAYKTYQILADLIEQGNHSINEFLVQQRCGLSALKLDMKDNAYKALQIARLLRQDNLEVNYSLGVLEFKRNNYEKAIQLFQSARAIDTEYVPALRYLGHSLFKIRKYKEAMNFIRRAIELSPEDKESLFVLAECYYEADQFDQALKIFVHLKNDPNVGSESCYYAGLINLSNNKFDVAVEMFELGMKYENVNPESKIEMKYKMSDAFIKMNNISKALANLKDIQNEIPGYKDVPALIAKYQELNANKNLQIFLLAPAVDFLALCRRVVSSYFTRARVKITNVTLNSNEWVDILAEIDTLQWSELVLFRFIRTTGVVGEITIRDFHSHIKDANAGKGICITYGSYTDDAKHFTEARLIDLIEKDQFAKILKAMDLRLAIK